MYYCYRQIVVLVFLLLDCFPGRPIDFRVSLPMFYHVYRVISYYIYLSVGVSLT